ncbi:MAG TPA: hypothetical protein VFN61_01895 [Acidimicrobiales bacterium]|nr:hypothetical protein [Acidimicrobiales bacterium]
MVVSTGRRHCAGVDLDSGALVRAWSPDVVDQRLAPYDLVDITVVSDPDMVPDPSEPEALVTSGAPVPVGRITGRRAAKLIRPLLHPENAPLLGFHGPAVPFWERRPDHPSVALAQTSGPLVVTVEREAMWCHFLWSGRPQVMACSDPRLAASLERLGRDIANLKPGTYLVVALEPPVNGHCQKVVEAVVPRR